MKEIKRYASWVIALCLILTLGAPLAVADSISAPLSAADVLAINSAAGSTYGPPPGVRFFEPGPLLIASGDETGVYSGPSHGDIDSVMFVVSMATTSHASLGFGTVDMFLDFSDPFFTDLSFLFASFGAGDFFTGAAAGFPASVSGIGDGEVHGLTFTDTMHAAAVVTIDALDVEGLGNEDLIGAAAFISGFDLRVDIFGISDGAMVNNTPNSGGIGVCASCIPPPPPSDPPPSDPPVPEPATLTLMGIGLAGLAARKAQKKS